VITGKRILLTGGRGFIGSHLALRLSGLGNEVVIVDNKRRDALRFQTLIAGEPLTVLDRDVMAPDALDDLLDGTHLVVHMAAVAGVSNYIHHPATTLTTNLLGTYNVLEALRRQGGVQRFLNFSTSEVYGPKAVDVCETDRTQQGPIGEARWTYAVSKTAAEHLCFAYYREYGIPTVSVRPFNIFGPAQVGEGAIHDISLRALQNKPVTVTGDGQQVRTWCYIDDMIDAVLLLLSRPEAVGKVFNVGNNRPVVSMLALANRIIQTAGSSSEIVFKEHIEADVLLRSPDVRRIKKVLGFSPAVSLEEGLRKTVDWYRDHLDDMLAVHETSVQG